MHSVTVINRNGVPLGQFLQAVLGGFGVDHIEYADGKTITFKHEYYAGSYVYCGELFGKVD